MPERTDYSDTEWLTKSQAATLCGVSISTILRYEKAGAITSVRTLGNHRRFSRDEVKALVQRVAS